MHESCQESHNANVKKHIHLDIDGIDADADADGSAADHIDKTCDETNTKKIISLNKSVLVEVSDSDDDDDSSSSDVQEDNANFELKIGYKPKKEQPHQPLHLNYGNMSVPALRQLAKERGLGGEDGDLQKLKKKELVQLLTSNSI
jgi:hypothetical protein